MKSAGDYRGFLVKVRRVIFVSSSSCRNTLRLKRTGLREIYRLPENLSNLKGWE